MDHFVAQFIGQECNAKNTSDHIVPPVCLVNYVFVSRGRGIFLISLSQYSRKVWDLNGNALYSLTTENMLKKISYANWFGISDHHMYLTAVESFEIPIKDPHVRPDEFLSPINSKLKEKLLFAKALTEYAKAIRIFIRCAMRYRNSIESHSRPASFWIRNGVMTQPVILLLSQFLD